MILKKAAALFFAFILTLSLTSCGNSLNGKYYSQDTTISQTFTFDGDKVTMSAFGLNVSGTYRIKDDNIEITYTIFDIGYTWKQPFSKSGKTITIGGIEFKKE